MNYKFAFRGKYFVTEEEFFQYAKEWKNLEVSYQEAEKSLELFKSNMLINLSLIQKKMTNQEFEKILDDLFCEYIRIIQGEIKQ